MTGVVSLAICLLTALAAAGEETLLEVAERSPIFLSDGTTINRIERDERGEVVRLRLDQMHLSAAQYAAIGNLPHLRQLNLYKANVSSDDLQFLSRLDKLESLNLSGTEITNDAIKEIVKLPELRTVCLGNVAITPEAVTTLKTHFSARGRTLALGYSQRKK